MRETMTWLKFFVATIVVVKSFSILILLFSLVGCKEWTAEKH